jgi:hypothetical protein
MLLEKSECRDRDETPLKKRIQRRLPLQYRFDTQIPRQINHLSRQASPSIDSTNNPCQAPGVDATFALVTHALLNGFVPAFSQGQSKEKPQAKLASPPSEQQTMLLLKPDGSSLLVDSAPRCPQLKRWRLLLGRKAGEQVPVHLMHPKTVEFTPSDLCPALNVKVCAPYPTQGCEIPFDDGDTAGKLPHLPALFFESGSEQEFSSFTWGLFGCITPLHREPACGLDFIGVEPITGLGKLPQYRTPALAEHLPFDEELIDASPQNLSEARRDLISEGTIKER